MNRVIKFRAWDRDQERMISADIFYLSSLYDYDLSSKYDCYPLSYRIKDAQEYFILMQYTGFKDVKGTDIYEGDILKYSAKDGSYYICEVLWHKECGSWKLFFPEDNNFEDLYDYVEGDDDSEIIGNIYENPELTDK